MLRLSQKLLSAAIVCLLFLPCLTSNAASVYPAATTAVSISTFASADLIADASASTGFYCGSFDPPTLAHEAIVQKIISGFRPGRLFILVNEDGPKDFKASLEERMSMLRAALTSAGNNVEIYPVAADQRNDLIRKLAQAGEKPYWNFLGEDSYASLSDEAAASANVKWVVFRRGSSAPILSSTTVAPIIVSLEAASGISSTQARAQLLHKKTAEGLLSPSVSRYIQRYQLYEQVPDKLLPLQEALFQEGFHSFLADMSLEFPQLDFSSLTSPPFNPQQSSGAWADKFIRWVVKSEQLEDSQVQAVSRKAKLLLFATYKDKVYAKLPHLQRYDAPSMFPPVRIKREWQVPLSSAIAPSDYNMDVRKYVSERIPLAIGAFLAKHKAVAYLHLGSENEAVAFHKKLGFTEFYRFSSVRHFYKYFILNNPETGEFRFMAAGLTSKDRLAQIQSQLQVLEPTPAIFVVEHEVPAKNFELNAVGKTLSCARKDLVVVGFKNTLWNVLSRKGTWRRQPISDYEKGQELDVYTNSLTGERIFNTRGLYGDETLGLLNYFYARGARRFLYLGTAGLLTDSIKIGDILMPAVVRDENDAWIPFDNKWKTFIIPSANPRLLHENIRHGWVQTVLSETKAVLTSLKGFGVQSIDIEAKYYAQFFRDKKDATVGLVLFAADETLGENTYDRHNVKMEDLQNSAIGIIQDLIASLDSSAPLPNSQPYSLSMAK